VTIAAWAELSDLPADRPPLPGGDDEWSRYLVAASETLYGLTGRRYPGVRERAVEVYAPSRCGERRCHRCAPIAVRLPNRPVVELLAVRTRDGELLPADSYRIARGGYLESAPGAGARLPTCSSPLRLRYLFGRAVGDAGRVHAAHLALALGQARLDPDSSPLPGTITSIVRQGVTFTQQPGSTLIEKGLTGLPSVDAWIGSVNPTRSTRRPRSWSPDTEARHYPLALTEVPLP
jgi:hypothetical protein